MKMIYSSLLIASALAFSACSAKLSTDDNDQKVAEQAAKWPALSDQALSGKIFGKDWTALTAVAQLSSFNSNQLLISFYGETKTSACSNFSSAVAPYASITIPAAYAVTEYRGELFDSNPDRSILSFGDSTNLGSNIYVSDRSRVNVTSIDDSGFQAQVWATGIRSDKPELSSLINGQVHVIDCRKSVSFSNWTDLIGFYKLQSFDGIAQNLRPLSIREDATSKFYDDATKSYIRSLELPLLFNVSASSDSQYDFGPMENLGVTKITTNATTKTMQYSFNGPIDYNDKDITLNLNVTVTKENQYLYVNYTVEVPGFIAKTNHYFTLIKAQ